MNAEQLEALARIVAHRGHPHAADTDLLLTLLEAVARTAASHYDRQNWNNDGEIDAMAILDTITGESHLHAGPNAGAPIP